MSHAERYRPYPRLINPDDEFYQVELTQNREGFRVLLQNQRGEAVRVGSESVYAYRVSDEGKRLRTLEAVAKAQGRCVFGVHGSEFLDWFDRENLNTQFKGTPIHHWAIATLDAWVAVLSVDRPTVHD